MILCDVVSDSVFVSKSIKILKLLSTNFECGRDVINFDLRQEEFVNIDVKEFPGSRIQIVETTTVNPPLINRIPMIRDSRGSAFWLLDSGTDVWLT